MELLQKQWLIEYIEDYQWLGTYIGIRWEYHISSHISPIL